MFKDVILNRLCYDRVKVREQTQHYQRLLEVKPTLVLAKPPRPKKKDNANMTCLTKKDRMKIDKEVEIQKENRIMLQKLLEIDRKKSELSKKKMKPVVFKIRSLSTGKKSNHPQIKLGLRS